MTSVGCTVSTGSGGAMIDKPVAIMLTKLDAISRTEAVAVAHKRGLIHL